MQTANIDQQWMSRALELAARGLGLASPNPVVGCVLLDAQGALAGEGWHEYAKRDHAEVAALKNAAALGNNVQGGTAYVTLEPCNHTGRTGPCSQALVDAGLKRVVMATRDPNPVAVGGLERLAEAGLETLVGVCEQQAQRLNEGFACWSQRKRPFVLMKVATSLDGRIAPAPGYHKPGQPYWITGAEARADVQLLRWRADAVLVGIDTVLADDPLLTDRSGQPRRRPLMRVVLDSALRLPVDCKMVQTAAEDVMVFTVSRDVDRSRDLTERGVRVVQLPAEAGRVPLDEVLTVLGQQGLLALLTETGSRLNTALLAAGLVDRIRLYLNPQLMGSDAVPAFRGLANPLRLAGAQVEQFGADLAVDALVQSAWTR